jgi:CBS domain-containing protein
MREKKCVGIITRADIINAIGSAYSGNVEAGE